MSDPSGEPTALPGATIRRRIGLFIALFLLFQLLAPLHYYLGDHDADERFAWRMFSSTDARLCTVALFEQVGDQARKAVPLESTVQRSWLLLLQGDRPELVERFLRWRCDGSDATRVDYALQCTAPDGTDLPPVDRSMDCATGTMLDGAR